MHLAGDSRCRPLCFVLTPGQANDAPAFEHVMAALRVPRAIGRPHARPLVVLADRAYSSRAIHEHLRRRGIRALIPQRSSRQPQAQRPPRRTSTFVRPLGLQTTQHRRTLHQPLEELARPGNPL
ncbi:transposase [Streptomyces sp. NPDC002817]